MYHWRTKSAFYILGLVVLCSGVVLTWVKLMELESQQKLASWSKTPCKIIEWNATVTHEPPGSRLIPQIVYEYSFGGQIHHSSVYDGCSDPIRNLRGFEAEGFFAKRGHAFCYVNPDDPKETSFHPAQLAETYILMVCGVLLVIAGLTLIIKTHVWVKQGNAYRLGLLMGLCLFCPLTLFMLGQRMLLAAELGTPSVFWNWDVSSRLIQIPARVEAIWMDVDTRKNKTYYSPHVLYSYEQEGQHLLADQWYYDNQSFESKDFKELNEQIEEAGYRIGHETTCWVHPHKPWIATLNPKVAGRRFWELIIVSLLTLLCGVLFKRAKKE